MKKKNENSGNVNLDPHSCWVLFSDQKPPDDIPVLVELEKELCGSIYQIGIFGRLPVIGSIFAFDAPKPVKWRFIPK
ncbi:MAG: hypothetical protein PHT07_15420 [Paludibacter sp.]|nr:hypothetical protein [Paludibacter sp.]